MKIIGQGPWNLRIHNCFSTISSYSWFPFNHQSQSTMRVSKIHNPFDWSSQLLTFIGCSTVIPSTAQVDYWLSLVARLLVNFDWCNWSWLYHCPISSIIDSSSHWLWLSLVIRLTSIVDLSSHRIDFNSYVDLLSLVDCSRHDLLRFIPSHITWLFNWSTKFQSTEIACKEYNTSTFSRLLSSLHELLIPHF